MSVDDDETIAVRVSESELVIPEGAAQTYRVWLGSQPSSNVTVNITKSGPDSGDVTVSPTSLVFTATNWRDRQEVTVTTTVDGDTDADSATLAHAATSSDADYSGIAIPSVAVEITEVPPPTVDLTIGTTKGWAVRGRSATYPVIDMDRAFEVTITFSEAVTGFEKHDVYAGYLGGPSVGISGSLTEVTAGLVYRGRVDKLVDGLLEIQVDTGGQTPIIASDGRRASVEREESGVMVDTAYLRVQVDAPEPSGPSGGTTVWTGTVTVGDCGGYLGYVGSGSKLGCSVGGLSDTSFTHQGTTYTVEEVTVNPYSATLFFQVSESLPNGGNGLTLEVGNRSFDFEDANHTEYGRQYDWRPFSPGWKVGDTVVVSLKR